MRTARHLPNPPPQFLASSQLSPEATFLLWHGLAPTTRKGYESAVNHYESFTRLRGLKPYPATIYNLTAWIASAIIKTKAKTTKLYLQGLHSYHIEMGYNIAEFNDPRLERVIRGTTGMLDVVHDCQSPGTFSSKSLALSLTPVMESTSKRHSVLDSLHSSGWENLPMIGGKNPPQTSSSRDPQSPSKLTATSPCFYPRPRQTTFAKDSIFLSNPPLPSPVRFLPSGNYSKNSPPCQLHHFSHVHLDHSQGITSSNPSVMHCSTPESTRQTSPGIHSMGVWQSPPSQQAFPMRISRPWDDGKAMQSTCISNDSQLESYNSRNLFIPRHSSLLPRSLASSRPSPNNVDSSPSDSMILAV